MCANGQLAAVLDAVDRTALSDEDLVRLLVARDRAISHLQAARTADIVEVVRRAGDDEFAHFEVGAALHLTAVAARAEVDFASALQRDLPLVGGLLASGDIDLRRARTVVDATSHLSVEEARQVVEVVAERLPDLTTGQARSLIRRTCLARDLHDAERRAVRAVEDRRVLVEPTPDGTADLLLLDLPADRAMAALDHLDHLATAVPPDGRSIDQRRSDIALDLLCGVGPASRSRGMVDLTVDLPTLMGLAERSADLGRWGPLVAEIARQVAGHQVDGRWQATVADLDGSVVAVPVRRRPTAAQRRTLAARVPRCIFPGCRRPARGADVDHRVRHTDGGPTSLDNLAPLCRTHHRAKDEGGWRYQGSPGDGYTWTSPLGIRHTTTGHDP